MLRFHKQRDLIEQQALAHFFAVEKPDYVFLAAASVGGIAANNLYCADFIYENLIIQANVIHQSWGAWGGKTAFPGQRLHLPARGASADVRGVASGKL